MYDAETTNPDARRNFLKKLLIFGMLPAGNCFISPASAEEKAQYDYLLPVKTDFDPNLRLPDPMEAPFNWGYIGLSNQQPLVLHFGPARHTATVLSLRFTSAVWLTERFSLEIRLLRSQEIICKTEIWNPYFLQPFDIPLEERLLSKILEEGIEVRTETPGSRFYIFTNQDAAIPEAFRPGLLAATRKEPGRGVLLSRLSDKSSLQFFGWAEGCIWDGLQDVLKNQARELILKRLDHFTDHAGHLNYLVSHNHRIQNQIFNVETILPFGILAHIAPGHPLVEKALSYCLSFADQDGVIAHKTATETKFKTEENYTLSYPLLLMAKQSADARLIDMAVANLLRRMQLLHSENGIFHRKVGDSPPVYLNWARGYAWYLLGLAKSLKLIPEEHPHYSTLLHEYRNATNMALRFMDGQGMFRAFLHETDTGADTSGTAGITAATAYGIANGFLPRHLYAPVVRKTLRHLWTHYLTPDGYLKGSCQLNNGGEELQKSDFRTISPYTLGFLGTIIGNGF